MGQTLKGLIICFVVVSLWGILVGSKSYAEWYNAKTPYSDSSNLRAIRENLEELNRHMAELVEIEKSRLEMERSAGN